MARRCTFSISLPSNIDIGFHIQLPYSKRGLNSDLYRGRKTGGGRLVKFRLNVPYLLLALATMFLMWELNFKLVSNVIPRSFSSVSL